MKGFLILLLAGARFYEGEGGRLGARALAKHA